MLSDFLPSNSMRIIIQRLKLIILRLNFSKEKQSKNNFYLYTWLRTVNYITNYNYNYNIYSNIDLNIYLKSRDTKMILVDF